MGVGNIIVIVKFFVGSGILGEDCLFVEDYLVDDCFVDFDGMIGIFVMNFGLYWN